MTVQSCKIDVLVLIFFFRNKIILYPFLLKNLIYILSILTLIKNMFIKICSASSKLSCYGDTNAKRCVHNTLSIYNNLALIYTRLWCIQG